MAFHSHTIGSTGTCIENKHLIQAVLEKKQKSVTERSGQNRYFDVHLHTSCTALSDKDTGVCTVHCAASAGS